MSRTSFQDLKHRLDLVEVAGRYVTLRRRGKEMVGPCPICGDGDDRFWVRKDGQSAGCRKCGFAGDVIDLVAKAQGISVSAAAERLAAGLGDSNGTPIAPNKFVRNSLPEWKSVEWQSRAKRMVEAGRRALSAPSGAICRDYLAWRSLSVETSDAMQFGYSPGLYDPVGKSKRPALLIPWIDGVGTVFAIKYRYIDDLAKSDKCRRFRQHVGSDPILFGLHAASFGSNVLIAVEGEFNAASIFQAVHGTECDVVSIGPERNSNALEALDRLIASRGYSKSLIWTDEPETALRAGERLDAYRTILMKSPNGLDANDLLCRYGADAIRQLIQRRMTRSPKI